MSVSLCKQLFKFLLSLHATVLFVLGDKVRAFQVIDGVLEDNVLELERLGLVVPGLRLLLLKLELVRQLRATLFKLVNHSSHLDALLSEEGNRVLQHPDLLALLHVEVELGGLHLEVGEFLLDAHHVVLVAQHEVRLVLLNDRCVQRV